MSRPAQAIINLAALRHNCQLVKQLAPASQIVAVVKANAYGHGAIAVARALEPMVTALAVACLEEAVELRKAGLSKPLLLLEGPFEAAEIPLALQLNCWLMLSNRQQVQQLLQSGLDFPLKVWLKADTGMHRLGLSAAELEQSYRELQALPQPHQQLVLASHFATADQLDSDFSSHQLRQFNAMTASLTAPRSLANSAAIMALPDSHGDYVRPGIMLYGSSPFDVPQANAAHLQPVMSLLSKVIAVRQVEAGEGVGYSLRWTAQRPSRIATVAIGYGDGYPRHAPNGTPVLVNGQRAELAGTVSMDMITVDVTGLKGVEIGTPVELWGNTISVDEVAARASTIGYELLTRMPMRTPRICVNA